MRYFAMCFLCTLVLFLGSNASADDRFTLLDANRDGVVTWEEFSAVNPNMPKLAFDAIDTNTDGSFSPEEWQAFIGNHAKEGMGRPDGKGMGAGMPGMPSMPPQHSTLPAREASPPLKPVVPEPGQPTVQAPAAVAPPLLLPPSGAQAPAAPKTPSAPNMGAPSVPTQVAPSVPNPNDPPQPSEPKSPSVDKKGDSLPRVPLLMPPNS